MSNLRFCFPATFYPPYSFGGDAIAIQRLARALVRRGHEVTVIHDMDAFSVVSGGESVVRQADDDGIEKIALHSSFGRISPLLAQQTGQPTVHRSTLREIFRSRAFDVVNFHNASLIGGPGIFGLARSPAILYTAHEHWLVCPTHVLWRHKREVCIGRQCIRCQIRYRRPPQLWRYNPRLKNWFERVNLYIAMSEFSRRKHAEFGFPCEMKVLPPFVPAPDVTVADASPHSRPYFFFAGRLEEIKGVQTVIPRMEMVPGADLLIAGEGSYRAELEKLAGERVRFVGELRPEELARYYHHALATIVPSITYETFGLTLIESFACGTPVIARRLGPFPEIVDACDGGMLFTDDVQLDAALNSLATDPALRQRLGENARVGHAQRWSEDVIVGRYLEMVDQIRAGPN
jgi:glycosyltransferase involved in cell wall biosynthesis